MPPENAEIAPVWGFIIAASLLVLLLFWVVRKLRPFIEELRYINMELRRSDLREQEHWRRHRRQLWLALFDPFSKI